MITFPNVVCIWYPSGGFGHFINGVLTLAGKDFKRPNNNNIEFNNNGNSHSLDLVAPKYFHDPPEYNFKFNNSSRYSVLVDNGINNESKKFCSMFPDAQVIKICYTDYTWPIVSRTMIEKAMNTNFDQHVFIDDGKWGTTDLWAQREKYFLFLRDHSLRFAWRNDPECTNINIDDMINYQQLYKKIVEIGIDINAFESLWTQWYYYNKKYLEPVTTAYKILQHVDQQIDLDLSNITDVWGQSVIYYFIWLKYKFKIPHNDYANWFTNTKDIVIMLNRHGVLVDTH